jgi:hypothetical protein
MILMRVGRLVEEDCGRRIASALRSPQSALRTRNNYVSLGLTV